MKSAFKDAGAKAAAPAGQPGAQGAPPAAARSEEASIRELVESCLVNDDFTPVLRIVFSGPSKDPATPTAADALLGGGPGASPPPDSASASAAAADPTLQPASKQQPLLDGRPALELLKGVLRSVAAEQDGVVKEVCSLHAMEIATCVAELDRMALSAEALRKAAEASSEALQRAGSTLASTSRDLHGLLSAQRHLAAGVGGLRAVRRLLARCGQVGQLLAARRLFAAHELLEAVRAQDLVLALEVLSNNTAVAAALATGPDAASALAAATAAAAVGSALDVGAGGTAGIAPKHQALVSRLRRFLQGLVSDLEAAVEYYAVAEFNNWLVGVRAESRQVGLRAIRQAAIGRQLGEDLAAERRSVAAALMLAEKGISGPSGAATAAGGAAVAAGATAGSGAAAAGGGGGGGGSSAFAGAGAAAAVAAAAAAGAGVGGGGLDAARGDLVAAVSERVVVGAPFRRDLAAEGAPAPPPGTAAAVPRGLARNATMRASTGSAAGGGAASGAASATSGPGPPIDIGSLHPGQPLQAIQALLARHRAAAASAPPPAVCALTDYTTGLLQGVDMQGLHRCVHIHRRLGRMPSLRRYYLQQRRLQITTDLAPPARFLEAYQAYLAQVVGFFVVEDAVAAAAPDLVSADSAALLWEAAAASLRGVLGRALEEALGGGAPASIMLLLKDFMLLVCSALGARGFVTAPVTELLSASRLRYHDLLTAGVALRVGRALAADPLAEGVRVASEAQAAELVGRLGLPAVLEGYGAGARPAVPYTAPYTACLPRILTAIRGFVSDSLAYLQGLLSPWELLPAVLHARDRLIGKTVVDALADHTARLLGADAAHAPPPPPPSRGAPPPPPPPGPWRPREVMHMVANASCLASAMQALDEWTLLQVRPLGAMAAAAAAAATGGAAGNPLSANRGAAGGGGGGPGGGGGAGTSDPSMGAVLAALRSVQDAGEKGLLRLIAARVEALVAAGGRAANWLPGGPLPMGMSPYAEELLALLRDSFDAAAATLPRSSFLFLARAVARAMGGAFMQLLKEGVKAYNLFALEHLAGDVAALDRYLYGLSLSGAVPGLADEFAEPRQLCALLLSPRVEEVLIPEVRRQRYGALDLPVLVLVMERYREQSRVDRTKEKTGHVPKRVLEGIAKQLRGQMVAGTAMSGPRVLEDV
ncbi:hypothetical protein HYH02_004875 [Chlamydomonas schloesseri]|uniref:Uncharacterized protein n=1 Tax=Chlamydomonas schloesseri TaxID=2026947 RepID=A0A835WMS4_9CHLO|nr:hypothetical protein HYH02_004875 [Chlamydomonas schloesseri]|eukprot:KAG2450370.1 hypothetical protein HYH02_004875 [Chlamydomonas schloesseri]